MTPPISGALPEPLSVEPPLPPPPGDVDQEFGVENLGDWIGSAAPIVCFRCLQPLADGETHATSAVCAAASRGWSASVPSPTRLVSPGTSNATRRHSGGQYHLPPHDLGAERAVLGSILIDPDAITEVADLLRPYDFYRQAHGLIFGAICALHGAGGPPDIVTVAAELEQAGNLEAAGGASYLALLGNDTPTAVHVVQYARIVADASQRRRLIEAAGKIAELGYSRDPDATGRAGEILRDATEGRSMSSVNIMAGRAQGVWPKSRRLRLPHPCSATLTHKGTPSSMAWAGSARAR